jgi:DNA polymerase elongation subunit (family B)
MKNDDTQIAYHKEFPVPFPDGVAHCMVRGHILDVYPDYVSNTMVTWLKTKNGTQCMEEKYEPHFYIYAEKSKLRNLARILPELPQVRQVQFTQQKLLLGSEKQYTVLQVTPQQLGSFHQLATTIDAWGGFHEYHLFNVDLRLPTRYLQSKGAFCNALVHWTQDTFSVEDTQWAVDYPLPTLTSVHLEVLRSSKNNVKLPTDQIDALRINDEAIAEGNEEETLLSAMRYLHRCDPDIVYTAGGDSELFPFLAHRARLCGIDDKIYFGRDQRKYARRLQPVKEAKSYFSYGRILYRPPFYMLKGRIHLDRLHSFLFGESGLYGLMDISRCANIPLQLLSRLGPGTAISQIQMNTAMKQGFLVAWKKNKPEAWKTGWELLRADRGGMILEPMAGIHEDVIELDYASLYPTIMVRYNISPETLQCSCCQDHGMKVPQLGYHICIRQRGLIPTVLQPILERRFCFKARSKNRSYDTGRYEELQNAWKWMLVVCFGYTGYRNARYGRIECHESITAFSRDILLSAVEIAEQAGYEVLHGIVDSLWVKQKQKVMNCMELARLIGRKTGIRMEVKGRNRWIVFLPTKGAPTGALNRYYGVFTNGKMKSRGIELRQHDTPLLLKQLQQDMLTVLAQAQTSQEFLSLIPQAVAVLLSYGDQVKTRNIDPSSLLFTTRVSRALEHYRVHTVVTAALQQLQDLQVEVQPGQSVRYLVTNSASRRYNERICVEEYMKGREPVDVAFYLRQMATCGESILLPFGYTAKKLEAMLHSNTVREKAMHDTFTTEPRQQEVVII